MKHLLLLTWFFFLACQKEPPLPEETGVLPVTSVTVYEDAGTWFIHATLAAPKNYNAMVRVETKHADGKTWWFFVIIEKGKTETTIKIPASAGPVESWTVGEWGEWN